MKMLGEYSSLIEVLTATYFTMCIDDVLRSIWTPRYAQKVALLLDQIDIPIAKNMRTDIERHVETFTSAIKKHMKVKSIFMLVFCLILLFLVGLESHLNWLKNGVNEVELVFRMSILFLLFICLGKYTFKKFSTLIYDFLIMGIIIICLYVHNFSITDNNFITENRVLCFMIMVLLIPILWQIFQCWVYSSLYYGYLKAKTKEEQILLTRAKQAYRIRQVAAAPVEYYGSVAADLERVILSTHEDSALVAINSCFVDRMEMICDLPWSVKLLWSDIKFHFKCFRFPNTQKEETIVVENHIFRKDPLPKFDEHTSVKVVGEEKKVVRENKNIILLTTACVVIMGCTIGVVGRILKKKNK